MTDREAINKYWEYADRQQSVLYDSLSTEFSGLSDDIQDIFDRFMRIELTGNLSKRETETLHRKIKQWQDAGYSDSYQLKLYMRDLENRSRIKGQEALFIYLLAVFTGRYIRIMEKQYSTLQRISQNTFERESGKKGGISDKDLRALLHDLPDGTAYEDQMFGYAQYGAKCTVDTVRNAKQRNTDLKTDSPEMEKIMKAQKNRLLKPSQPSTGQSQGYHGYLDQVMTSVVGYSAMQAFQSTGAEEYIFIATIDGRTTEACKHLNQKRFKVSEMKLGVNVPPITVDWRGQPIPHPCRSIIRTVPKDTKQYTYPDSPNRDIIRLSYNEESAIIRYISSESYIINDKLRRGIELNDLETQLVNSLDSALEKMPKYNGNVYRSVSSFGIDDIGDFVNSHVPGTIIRFPSYTSTSTAMYDEGFPIQYVISSQSGRDIREYNQQEEEILFPRDFAFRVVKVEGNTIFMEET